MTPRLVLCHCCECGCVALAVCEVCAAAELCALVERRIASAHPSNAAFEELVASYHRDSFDRESAAAPGRDS